MKIQIWYAEPFNGGFEPPARYVHVADFVPPEGMDDAAALELAWRHTQNLEGSWSRGTHFEDGTPNRDYHPALTIRAPLPVHDGKTYGHRSSSMGDVFMMAERAFGVASMGFERLAPSALAHFLEAAE